jgi:mannan endo-1,6-alpha-mannosidase
MAALEVVLGTMVSHVTAAVTNTTGGDSASDPHAGYNASSIPPGEQIPPATKADRVGAWFLTALFSLAALYMWWFMNTNSHEWSSKPTVRGRTGRRGRTISTIDMDSSESRVLAAGVIAAEKERGLVQERGVANGGTKRTSNVLTKQQTQTDRSSTFSSTGVFPSDRNGHARSASYVSEGARNSLRGLPPIVEKDGRDRERRRRRSSGIHSAREGHVGSRFKEEEMSSRLD